MTVQAHEESSASPHRVHHHDTAERCPSLQNISNRSRRGNSMHGLVPEPCSFTGRAVRLAGEHAAVHTRSPSHLVRRVRSTPHYETLRGNSNWNLPNVSSPGQPHPHYQGTSVNLECGDHFSDASFHESWKSIASSPQAPVADTAVPLDDFEHDAALGHCSSQNEYFSSTSTPDLVVGWSGRLDRTLLHPEPPVLNFQCLPFATQADSERCLRTAECSQYVDQEHLSWRQFCQSPTSQEFLTPRTTCSLDVCSSWSSSLQGPTLNDCNSFRSFAVAPRHKDVLLSSRAAPGRCIFPYQDDFPEIDGWNTYKPCGTSSELLHAALPFTTSTSKASPEETAPTISFSSQYFFGDSDPLGSQFSLQRTSSEAACVIERALEAPHALTYSLTKPEQSEHKPDRPKELYPKPTESFSAPAPETNSFDWSSSPYLSDSFEYTPGISNKKNARRNSKDGFLIRSKLSGMSYREIKVKGRFKEAESTLRGRFRTLTKRKEQRVRKPQWHERDVQLLREAVLAVAEESKDICPTTSGQAIEDFIKSNKIPWKRVAERVAEYGSYHFGNATCRKKWDELYGHTS